MAQITVEAAGNMFAERGYNPTENSESDIRIEIVPV